MWTTTAARGAPQWTDPSSPPTSSATRPAGTRCSTPSSSRRATLRLPAHRGVLQPDALAVLLGPGQDARAGDRRRRARLRPRHRTIRTAAVPGHRGSAHRLRLLLLPVPHPDGPALLQPLRPRGASPVHPLTRPRLVGRRGAQAPGGGAGHRPRTTGPSHPADARPDRTAAGGGARSPGGRYHRRGRDPLLRLPWQGRQAGTAGAAQARPRGHARHAGRRWAGPGHDGGTRPGRCGRPGLACGASAAARSTASSGATSWRPVCHRRGSTSCAIPRRSSDATPGSPSRRCQRSSTIRRCRSRGRTL